MHNAQRAPYFNAGALGVFIMVTLALFLCRSVIGAPGPYTSGPYNTTVFTDTVILDGTETEYMSMHLQDNGGMKTLIIEARDDSTAGFANDSCCASVELLQGFNAGNSRNVFLFPSRAHPDSTTWPYGSAFSLDDSLHIAEMCTTCAWVRTATPRVAFGDTVGWNYNQELDSAISGYGALIYYPISPDFSPFLTVKLTGKANNLKRGSRWVLRVVQEDGIKVSK
jgi:hypothetical protein